MLALVLSWAEFGANPQNTHLADVAGRLARRIISARLGRGEHRFALGNLPKGNYIALVKVDQKTLRTPLSLR